MSNLISIVVPACNEEDNLSILHQRIAAVFENLKYDWELIVVDDHSRDQTFRVIQNLAKQDNRVSGFRFSRNFGSHKAIAFGLQQAQGDAAVVLAADLQDPPEIIPQLVTKWEAGAQTVWSVRARREGEKKSTIALARLYYFMMRHCVGLKEMPPSGTDFFLADRIVIDAMNQIKETHLSLIALIAWMGFRQDSLTYDKKKRLHGRSNWTLAKKFKLAWDSTVSFSDFPIRFMRQAGMIMLLSGLAGAGLAWFGQRPVSIGLFFFLFSGLQIFLFGVMGEYLWQALNESRRRPMIFIEARTTESRQAANR